ncbi:MAG: hypothetical protein LUH14_03950, partial [Clostridiaceae bacterium]|nr:hypothetical protein [Clostridiaceae bacterium]
MKRKNYRKEFNQLKKTDKIEKEMYCTIQSILPVKKISLSGVFQIGEDLYSQTYFLEDANFSIKTFEEQAYFLQDWCNLQSSIDTRFKITVFNKNRDMRLFSERVFYKTEQDSLKKLEKAYNELIQSAIMKCRQGIEAVLYLTVTVQRKSMQSAKESFAVLQSELERQFQTMGSRIELLDAAERLDIFNDFYHMFQPERKVDLEACIASGRDWRNEIFGEEIRVKNDHLLFGDAYVKSFYFDPTDFPTDISDRFFKMLSGISCRSLITIDYVPIPKDTAINMLKQKSSGIEQEIARQQEKRNANGQFTNDITLDVRMKKKNLEAKYDKVSGSDLTTFWTGFTVVLVEQDEKAVVVKLFCNTLTQFFQRD